MMKSALLALALAVTGAIAFVYAHKTFKKPLTEDEKEIKEIETLQTEMARVMRNTKHKGEYVGYYQLPNEPLYEKPLNIPKIANNALVMTDGKGTAYHMPEAQNILGKAALGSLKNRI